MSECKWTRERCQNCQKAIFRSKAEAEKEAKRLRRYKGQYRGMKAYHSHECQCWHLGDGSDHSWRKVAREKMSRRKDWL